ncbi:MAG: glucokinase, partial [Gammaproteobacteria bacterium]
RGQALYAMLGYGLSGVVAGSVGGWVSSRWGLAAVFWLAAASAALDLFIDLYGAWVGNVAMLAKPAGGLYVAGGVAGHLRARMLSPRFMAAATDKGRMRSLVERTPIFLVTNDRLGMQGAIATAHAFARDAFDTTIHLQPAVKRSGT